MRDVLLQIRFSDLRTHRAQIRRLDLTDRFDLLTQSERHPCMIVIPIRDENLALAAAGASARPRELFAIG